MKHARKTISSRSLPASIAALIAMSPLASTTANADELAYTMTTIIDIAHGDQVAAGKYEEAIENLTATDNRSDALFKATNLCVAYTKVGNFAEATIACDAAVGKANEMSSDRRSQMSKRFRLKAQKSYLAMSLTNRGVLHAVMGNVELAHQDFVDALDTYSGTKVAKINLARLGEIAAAKA